MRKKCGLLLLSVIFLSITAANTARAHGLPAHGVAYVPYSSNAPEIDGLWTNTMEWADATVMKVENESTGWTFYIGLKYNRTHIFVLLDFVSDKTPSSHDFGGVFIDSADDGGSLPQPDDYGFVITPANSLISIFQGSETDSATGQIWTQVLYRPYDDLYKGGFSGKNDPYESEAHRIMEFAISRNWFRGQIVHYGFYAFVSDRHSGIQWPSSRRTLLEWPIGAGGKNIQYEIWASDVPPMPERWGDIVFYEDINTLHSAHIELQNNYTEIKGKYQALLESNNSLYNALNQMELNYSSLNKRFNDLQTAYFSATYLSYSLLLTIVVIATIALYKTKLQSKPHRLRSKPD